MTIGSGFPSFARIPLQHPVQVLGRQPAPQPSPRVLLGPLEERLAETLVEAFGRSGSVEAARAFSSSTQSRVAAPGRPVRVPSAETERSVRCGAGAQ